jgi:hypothetical protein
MIWCSSYLGRLLIWEDCYYGPSPSSAPCISGSETFREWEGSWDSPEIRSSQLRSQVGDKVHSLVNVMMMNNQVNVVGEGYVFFVFLLFYFLSFFKCFPVTKHMRHCFYFFSG